MILLTTTTDKLQLVTSAAITTDVYASYLDYNGSVVTPGRQNTAITTAATTDILAAPGSGVYRSLKSLNVRNKHASSPVAVTILFNQNGTPFELFQTELRAGFSLRYSEEVGFTTFPDIPPGVIIQTTYAETSAMLNPTATIPMDNTIPQNTEGTEVLTNTITPKRASSRIRTRFQGFLGAGHVSFVTVALFKDSDANAIQVGVNVVAGAGYSSQTSLEYEHAPATTSLITYKIRVGAHTAGTTRFNNATGVALYGGAMKATMICEEIVV